MPKYKFTYFDMRAKGELIRLLFAAANVEYEDVRISFSDWPKMKNKTPLGQLPVLEVDGVEYPQSLATTRFIAKQLGFVYGNPTEDMKCDVIVETCYDLRVTYLKFINLARRSAPGSDKEQEARRKLNEEGLPIFLPAFDKFLAQYGGTTGYIVGNKMTWADLAVFDILDATSAFVPDLLKDFPKLSQHTKLVKSHPRLRAYLEKRPAAFA